MAKDYIVSTDQGIELPAATFQEARQVAASLKEQGFDPIIDQYEDGQLTGVFWEYEGTKLVKHA